MGPFPTTVHAQTTTSGMTVNVSALLFTGFFTRLIIGMYTENCETKEKQAMITNSAF